MKCWISKAHIFQRNMLSKSRIPDSTWSQCRRDNEREEVVLECRPLNESDLSVKNVRIWGHQLDMDRILKLVILGLKRRKVFRFQRELTSSNWWTTSDITSGTCKWSWGGTWLKYSEIWFCQQSPPPSPWRCGWWGGSCGQWCTPVC